MSDRRVAHTTVGDLPVALVTENDLLDAMVEDAARFHTGELPGAVTVLDSNGQTLSLARADPAFAAALRAADIVHADGQFIVWMSRLGAGRAVPERTATTDLLISAAERAVAHDLSFYLLGSPPEVNAGCAAELQRRFPTLRIVGRRHGYFTREEEAGVIAGINACKPDILWVGLGKPKEQSFAIDNRDRLDCAWIVTCGGCFHYVVGDYARAPGWMQRSGLEWLHRMATGPRYLVKRYLLTIPHAIGIVLYTDLLRPRLRRRDRGART